MTCYPDLKNVKKILVAKLRHHGDVLLTSPVFSVLKKNLPHAEIDAYIYKSSLPMLEGHEAISGFILYDQQIKKKSLVSKVFYEIKLLWKIYKKHYDLVINLTEGDRGALAAVLSRAPLRIGFDPEKSGMWAKKHLYTHLARKCHQTRHTVEKDLDVIRCLGLFPLPEERDLSFFVADSTCCKMQEMLHAQSIKEFILIHPVSRWLFKCLPEKTIAEVIRYLDARGEKIVLSASSDPLELAMNEKIKSFVKEVPILDVGGKISLKELGALIKLSKLLICVDSVPMHMASALKAPVVAMFGPTSEKTWAPWRHPFARVVTEAMPCRPCYMPGCGGSRKSDCLEQMSSKKICEAVEELLGLAFVSFHKEKSSPR